MAKAEQTTKGSKKTLKGAESKKGETPKITTNKETKKVDVKKSDTPKKAEAKKADASKKVEAKKTDAPKKAEAKKNETKKTDASKKIEPKKIEVAKKEQPQKGDVKKTDVPKKEDAKKVEAKNTETPKVTESKKVIETHKVDEKNMEDAKTTKVTPEETASVEEVAEEETAQTPERKRYDILLVSASNGFKPADTAIRTMVMQLAYRGFATPVEEALAETWMEIYFEPSNNAHEVFWEKEFPEDVKVFDEVVLRVQDKPFFAEYGGLKQPLYWSLEFRNCLFKEPIGHFKKLFLEAIHLRLNAVWREHEEAPPRKVVPEDEMRPEKKKRERGAGLAGTHVEEL